MNAARDNANYSIAVIGIDNKTIIGECAEAWSAAQPMNHSAV